MAKVQRLVETRISANVLGQPFLLAKGAPDRIWLGISAPGMGANVTVSTRPDVTQSTGWNVSSQSGQVPQFKLTRDEDYFLVQQEWWGATSAVPPNTAAVVLEVFEEESGAKLAGPQVIETQGGVMVPAGGIPGGLDRAAALKQAIDTAIRGISRA